MSGLTCRLLTQACLVVTEQLQITQMNDAGRRLLDSSSDGAVRLGRLRHLGVSCTPDLPQALVRCKFGHCVDIVFRMEGNVPLMLGRLVALPVDARTHAGTHHQPRYLLAVRLPPAVASSRAERVAELYGFTPAEVRTLMLVMEGRSASEIADASQKSLATVRTHLRGLLEKTGTTRQADLCRLFREVWA